MDDSKKTIVLNRMYAGSYLSTHLGHEVINMFQADNGKHYLYLNAKGNFEDKGTSATDMLLVMYVGGKRVEVIGLAKGLKSAPGAQCSLPRHLDKVKDDISVVQRTYILNETKNEEEEGGGIHYGGVPMLDLFGTAGQQNVFVSYEVEKKSFCLLVDRLRGKQEIVVKPIPDYIKKVKGLSGCTQLGDGSIALILDVAGMVE